MLAPCRCSENAEAALRQALGVRGRDAIDALEIEFREVPYFLVARSQAKWNPEASGDINEINILHVNDRGLVVDPDSSATGPADQAVRHTLIPWNNIISLSITRAPGGAGGSEN